MAIQYNLR